MSSNLRKCFSMQPLGFINPGGPYSYADSAGRNVQWFKDTGTRWVRLWVDWLTLEPNYNQYDQNRLGGLDEQIRRARANGVQVMLTVNPRFPCWVTNGCLNNPYDPAVSPTDFGWDSAYKRFIHMLYDRYKPFSPNNPVGAVINIFEVCNEPNLMLKPKGDEVHAFRTIDMFRTAQRISADFDHQLHLAGPGLSDRTSPVDPADPESRYVRFERFMDLMRSTGFLAASNFIWTHHNYGDVEADNAVNVDFARSHINGWWTGYDEGDGPVVFCTEGGARVAKMLGGDDYTRFENQAIRVGNAFQRLKGRSRTGMQSNYMTCDDVTGRNSGLVDPPPSTAWRSGMATWASVTTGATDVRKWRVGQELPAWTQWDPGFLSRHEGHLEVFAIGQNKECYNSWSGNGGASWSSWNSLGGGCSSAPGVVSMRSDLMDMFVLGDNGQLWHKYWNSSAGWGGWHAREGWCASDPAVASMNDRHLDVFVRWGDGTLWHRWWTVDTGWVGWSQLFGGQVVGAPSAVSWADGRIDLVFRGTDNRIHAMHFQNGWHGPNPLPGGGGATGSPEITSWKPGHLDVICPGAGGKLWRLTYDRLWGDWEPIPHTAGHWWSPGATTYKYGVTGRLDLMFHRGNRLRHVYLT